MNVVLFKPCNAEDISVIINQMDLPYLVKQEDDEINRLSSLIEPQN